MKMILVTALFALSSIAIRADISKMGVKSRGKHRTPANFERNLENCQAELQFYGPDEACELKIKEAAKKLKSEAQAIDEKILSDKSGDYSAEKDIQKSMSKEFLKPSNNKTRQASFLTRTKEAFKGWKEYKKDHPNYKAEKKSAAQIVKRLRNKEVLNQFATKNLECQKMNDESQRNSCQVSLQKEHQEWVKKQFADSKEFSFVEFIAPSAYAQNAKKGDKYEYYEGYKYEPIDMPNPCFDEVAEPQIFLVAAALMGAESTCGRVETLGLGLHYGTEKYSYMFSACTLSPKDEKGHDSHFGVAAGVGAGLSVTSGIYFGKYGVCVAGTVGFGLGAYAGYSIYTTSGKLRLVND